MNKGDALRGATARSTNINITGKFYLKSVKKKWRKNEK